MPFFFFEVSLQQTKLFSSSEETGAQQSYLCHPHSGFWGCWLQPVGQSLALDRRVGKCPGTQAGQQTGSATPFSRRPYQLTQSQTE